MTTATAALARLLESATGVLPAQFEVVFRAAVLEECRDAELEMARVASRSANGGRFEVLVFVCSRRAGMLGEMIDKRDGPGGGVK